MIGSYGVYCRRANADDDGGFSQGDTKGANYYAEHRVVVNSGRNGTTTNTIVENDPSKEDDKFVWCCVSEPKMQAERNSHWYKSSMAVLLLAISLAVLLMVSGLLLYFKYFSCKYARYIRFYASCRILAEKTRLLWLRTGFLPKRKSVFCCCCCFLFLLSHCLTPHLVWNI